jgi:dTDP-4-amino-4,6-dideoxygalactose transaminase
MIPYLDLKKINLKYESAFNAAFNQVLHSGWYILGQSVETFEKEYASFSDTNYAIGVANGLDALILSLKALGVSSGDEVIVPSNTYIASWLAVSYLGATPVSVEPRIDTYNINPDLIEQAITKKTKVIMPVNLYGQAAELESICAIAKKHALYVVEDNAQSQGATYKGKSTGSWGDINATSFYPGKNLGALGDAGAITTNDELFNQQIRILRNYGSEKKYYNQVKGFNSRLDELQAALLSIKLKSLAEENNERIEGAAIYNSELQNIGDLMLPAIAPDASSVYHIYQIRTKQRDKLIQHLSKNEIGHIIHYPVPPHLQEAYKEMEFKKGDFPIAEEIAETCLSIPLYPDICQSHIERVIDTIKNFF